jgi:hypothetical protein
MLLFAWIASACEKEIIGSFFHRTCWLSGKGLDAYSEGDWFESHTE